MTLRNMLRRLFGLPSIQLAEPASWRLVIGGIRSIWSAWCPECRSFIELDRHGDCPCGYDKVDKRSREFRWVR